MSGASKERGRPFRSKLRPYSSEIAIWQREGKTYHEMAVLLRQLHGLKVHPDTINSFVLVRVRARRKKILPPEYLMPAREKPTAEQPVGEKKQIRLPASPPAKGIVGSDGKEIRNAQYAPVNPDEL